MNWDVKSVKPLPDYRIYVEIEDGRKGIFDLKPYLAHGVFRELRDLPYFNQVDILFGAVVWPHEQDIAPETLVAEMMPVDSIFAASIVLERSVPKTARRCGSFLTASYN